MFLKCFSDLFTFGCNSSIRIKIKHQNYIRIKYESILSYSKVCLFVCLFPCLSTGLKTYLISGKKMGSQCGCSQNSLGRDFSETPRPSPHTHTSELAHSAMADYVKVGLSYMHTSHTHPSLRSEPHTHTHTCHMYTFTA